MSSLDPSMLPMLEMYVYETNTLIEQLDEIMLEAEKSGALGSDSINEIFRIMHTIKGSSAMMSIDNVSHLAHSIEDMFFIIREKPEKLGECPDIFDILFEASDFFKAELQNIQNATFEFNSCDDLMDRIKVQVGLLKGAVSPAGSAAPTQSGSTAAADDDMVQIQVFFDDDCQMENIRAYMLISSLTDYCSRLDSIPAHPESDPALSEEIIKNGLIIRFAPQSALTSVTETIESAMSIKSYKILAKGQMPEKNQIKSESAAAAQEPPKVTQVISEQQSAKRPEAAAGKNAAKQSIISVNQQKLDLLMDLVGEIVIAESMVIGNPDLKGLKLDNFQKATRQLQKLTDELQDIVMSMRMVPLSGVFLKMQRILRDTAKKLDKKAEMVTDGDDTEVDKTVSDIIADPLMHMVRNSIDHAIELPHERIALGKPEVGTVTLTANNAGGEIVITIADDGKGLNTEAILNKARRNGILTKPESEYSEKEIFQLIMLPGFSTNENVTEFSGRGVGMDVVSRNIELLGGTITVDSKKGVGTTFTIKIPLTLAIIEGMQVLVGDTVFTLPITSIKQSFKLDNQNQIIYDTDHSEMIMIRGKCYPIIRLHELYNIPTSTTTLTDGILVLIENHQNGACLFVDKLMEKHQVVVKPFPPFLNRQNVKGTGLSGCTILGDGSISLILDSNSLLRRGER